MIRGPRLSSRDRLLRWGKSLDLLDPHVGGGTRGDRPDNTREGEVEGIAGGDDYAGPGDGRGGREAEGDRLGRVQVLNEDPAPVGVGGGWGRRGGADGRLGRGDPGRDGDGGEARTRESPRAVPHGPRLGARIQDLGGCGGPEDRHRLFRAPLHGLIDPRVESCDLSRISKEPCPRTRSNLCGFVYSASKAKGLTPHSPKIRVGPRRQPSRRSR
jgi:hypothetical protein